MATIAELARRIDLSERHTKTLIDSGVLKHAASGRHDLDAQTILYIRHLRQVKRGVEGGGSSTLSNARARVAVARAETAEYENEINKGEWCRSADVVKMAIIEIVLIRENLLGAPGKIADPLHQVDREEAFHIVDDEVRECLGRLASGKGGIEFAIEMIERSGGKANPAIVQMLKDLELEEYMDNPNPKRNANA